MGGDNDLITSDNSLVSDYFVEKPDCDSFAKSLE